MLTFNTYKDIIKKMMICFQYRPESKDDARELIETYFKALSKSEMTNDKLSKVASRLVLSWRPEFGRKFPSVKEITDLAGVSVGSIAEKAHKVLKIKIMTIGGYGVLDLGKEYRHFVAMESIRRLGGWFTVCQQGVESFERNKKRFCDEFEDLYYSGNVPKKPLLCGSDLRNQEFLANYNSNQIDNTPTERMGL